MKSLDLRAALVSLLLLLAVLPWFKKTRKAGICWWVTMAINSQVDSVSVCRLRAPFLKMPLF